MKDLLKPTLMPFVIISVTILILQTIETLLEIQTITENMQYIINSLS